jgi:hypothetical protein
MTPTTALILVALLLVWLFIRRRQATRTKPDTRPVTRVSQKNTDYHAVSIKFESHACQAAQELEQCNCRFVHHKDRRSGKDRRSPFGPGGIGGSTGKYTQEQRQGKDRRVSEDEDLF